MFAQCEKPRKNTLEEHWELFKCFVDTSGQALGMTELDGAMIYANQSLCHLMEVDRPEDLYDKNLSSFYSPEAGRYLKEEVLPLVLNKGRWSGELVLLSLKGKQTHTIEHIYLLKDNADKPLCCACAITDISDHIRMEEQLRTYRDQLESLVQEHASELQKSKNAFRALFDSAPGPICLVNNRTITAANPAMSKITGYSQEELTNKPANMLYADDDEYQRVGNIIYEQLKRKDIMTIETRLKDKDGALVHTMLSLCPLNPHDITAGVIVTGIDITERKKLEAQLLLAQSQGR